MHKQVEVQGGFKNLKPPKKKGSETKESGRGGAVGGGGKGGGGKSGGQTGGSAGKNRCYCCGSGEHWSNSCDHPIASKIPLKADGCLLIICYNCFEAGHSRAKCPKKKADSGEGQSGGRGFFAGRRGLEEEVRWAEGRDPQEVFLDKDLSLGEVALDFRLGEPRGVFPVLDSGKGEKGGGNQVSESTPVSPESLGLGNLKTQREEDLRKGGKEDMQYPFSVGDLNILGILDSGADYLLVDLEIWGQLEGEKVSEPIGYLGVSGVWQQIESAKMVVFRVEDGQTSWLAYPLPNQKLGIKALVPWDLAKELGAALSGVPKFFVNQVHLSDDKRWVRGEEVFEEKMLPEGERAKILEGIGDVMGRNEKLPANSTCSLEGAEYKIKIAEGAQLTYKAQYLICEKFLPQVKKRMEEWLEKGWVSLLPPDKKPDWHSPVLAVKKISGNKWNGDICLCMDFRWVNSVTVEPSYMVPLCREMLGRLVGLKIFSELDLVDAYHQIVMEKGLWEFTTFTIPGKGKACWRVLFFGTKGAVAFFQKIIERALGEVSFSIVIVIYVDNILVGLMDLETHIQELKLVIEALTRAGLRLKPSKCKVGYLAIQFMGAVVDRERRGVDPHKVQVFVSMRKPQTGKEVQRVLGFLNFLRDFIPLYANIVGLLEKWRSARVISDGEWEKSGAREAFERAKKVLSNAPVLHNPDWSREFILETDASQFGVGAVLFQEVGGEKRYVDFAAKVFNKAQQNYGAAKRELLAGLFVMARWRPWLLYRRFTWGMDSKVMTFINSSTNWTVLDWINLFMEFDFVTKFKKGVLNVLPHELSHCYDLLELDFGRGEKLGDKGVGLLGKTVLVARGVGTGFEKVSSGET